MIRKHFNIIAISAFLLLTAILIVYKQFSLSQSEVESHKALKNFSQQVSSLELSLFNKKIDIKTRQGLSAFLQGLDSNAEIAYWKLKNVNGEAIDQKIGSLPDPAKVINHTSFIPTESNSILTLEVAFYQNRPSGSVIGVAEVFFLGGFAFIFLAILMWKFHWLYDIERFSQQVLEQQSDLPTLSESAKSNSIALSIIHLFKLNKMLIADKRALTDQIRKTNYVDHVTELGNKSFFKAEFQVRLFHHDSPESGLLILFSFVEKDFEETMVLDDERLVQIAGVLRRFSEEYSDALVARLNQTDFVLLTPNQSQKDVDLLCRKIIGQLEKTVFDNTKVVEHFVDIGISAYKQGFDYYKVMAEADMALRNAQLQGGNNWFMYGEALPVNKVRGHLKWRSFLQRVLDKRQIQLYGQSVIYFGDSKVEHQEVFARIEDGNDTLTADTFLPMASRCGLAAEFDRQVVDTLIKHCLHSDVDIKNQKYAINLFISSLIDERFIGWLIGKLSSFPELCKHFIFEVKETQVIEKSTELKPVMEQLSQLGAQWCIERFGEPDAQLDYLEELPISMVKVDRRIIHQISSSSRRQLLVKSLLINLKGLGIQAFAEGVEDEADAEYLRSLDFSGAQGFYFSQPRRLGGIEKMLKVI